MKIKIGDETKKALMALAESKRITLEGNILKVIDDEGDDKFAAYIKDSIEKDNSNRRKRLEITKQVQSQNTELTKGKEEIERVNEELRIALEAAEAAMMDAESARKEAIEAKNIAESDLDFLQKKTQFELIGTIVKVSLWVILGVGVVTTGLFMFALLAGKDTAVVGATWSNIVGILLTNAFSIIGTIMGVKYASEKKS